MRQQQRTWLYGFTVALAVLLAACGGKETMASKSAAAYREAQAKGTPAAGGHEHGGHAVESPAAPSTMTDMSGMDHATMTGMDHATTTGTDHSKMSTTDHSKMTAADHSKMAGMDHSKAQSGNMAGMDHSGAMPGMHPGAAASPVAVVTAAPRSSAEMARVEPGATLRPDAFDAPSPIAVAEAAKAVGGGGHGGHSMAPPSSATAEATGSQAVIYTCPMHPEVTSAAPGKCPKCGMTLVKKEK